MDQNAYLIELSESDRTAFGRVDFSTQGPEQRVLSAVWALESEVNSGGFLHYFVNSGGDTASFAPKALPTIGAASCADVVERALQVVVPSSMFLDDQERRESLANSLSENSIELLEQLNLQFYSYPDDLTSLLYAYVAANPTVFGPVPAGA